MGQREEASAKVERRRSRGLGTSVTVPVVHPRGREKVETADEKMGVAVEQEITSKGNAAITRLRRVWESIFLWDKEGGKVICRRSIRLGKQKGKRNRKQRSRVLLKKRAKRNKRGREQGSLRPIDAN